MVVRIKRPQMKRGQPVRQNYVAEAVAIARESYAPLLKIQNPIVAGTFTWRGEKHIHVSGLVRTGERRLVEVFRLEAGALVPVPAYAYPPPIRDLFPADYAILYSDNPWNGEFPPSGTMADAGQMA